MWLTPTELGKIEGVNSQKIRRKIKSGLYAKVKRTSGGHYQVFVKQKRLICYARTGSPLGGSEIVEQKRILLKRYPDAKFISDRSSICNFEREGLHAILKSAILGDPIHLVVTTKDRLADSGFELIRWLIELSGGHIEILNDSGLIGCDKN